MHEVTPHHAGRHGLLLKGVCSTWVNRAWSFWSNKPVNPYANRHYLLMQTCLRQRGETAQVQQQSFAGHCKSLGLHCGPPKRFGLQTILDHRR